MRELFNQIIELDHVRGCVFILSDGEIAHSQFNGPAPSLPKSDQLRKFFDALEGMIEVDLLFEEARLYIRQADHGHLVIIMESFAVLSMIRLQCEVLIPALNAEKPKGLMRFFKKA